MPGKLTSLDNLTLGMRIDSSGEYYEFGANVEGAFIVISSVKAAGADEDIAEAQQAEQERVAQEQAAQQQQTQTPSPPPA